jgi:hypothetical protein
VGVGAGPGGAKEAAAVRQHCDPKGWSGTSRNSKAAYMRMRMDKT